MERLKLNIGSKAREFSASSDEQAILMVMSFVSTEILNGASKLQWETDYFDGKEWLPKIGYCMDGRWERGNAKDEQELAGKLAMANINIG